MPSTKHDGLVRLFDDHPKLAAELLRRAPIELPDFDSVTVEPSDLTQVAPTPYHADLTLVLRRDEPCFGIVVEVQLAKDPRKKLTWPVYGTTFRANIACPTAVVVVAPDAAVARWAAKPIDVGPGSVFTPVVFGPKNIPAIEDPDVARREPELAVLSSAAHADDDDPQAAARVAFAALVACFHLDTPESLFYADFIRLLLPEPAGRALEALMQSPENREFQSEFARKYVAQGRTEGEAAAILVIASERGLHLSEEQKARIVACTDLDTLSMWLRKAVRATTADEVFD